ncbi:MAG: methyltransferase domain-containing protein [Alphaproteobacteria bacterium]|nr:methyltransferase domain-containing protein [Alphaproteobacteria bacterium]
MSFKVDFGKTAGDYARHRAGFPPALLERLKAHGLDPVNRDVLDLGTGTGTLARQAALAGGRVTGVDPSESMMTQAAEMDSAVGAAVDYRVGRAEAIPVQDESQDIVLAGQCWHWFRGAEAAREVARVLRSGGHVAICHFDWLPLPGNVVEATEKLIEAFNPSWRMGGGTGIHPKYLADLSGAGFRSLETFSFDIDAAYTHEAWRGRIRASAGVAASLAEETVAAFDDELRRLLAASYLQDPLAIPHRVWAVVGRKASVAGL